MKIKGKQVKSEEHEGKPMRKQWKPMENKEKIRKMKENQYETRKRKENEGKPMENERKTYPNRKTKKNKKKSQKKSEPVELFGVHPEGWPRGTLEDVESLSAEWTGSFYGLHLPQFTSSWSWIILHDGFCQLNMLQLLTPNEEQHFCQCDSQCLVKSDVGTPLRAVSIHHGGSSMGPFTVEFQRVSWMVMFRQYPHWCLSDLPNLLNFAKPSRAIKGHKGFNLSRASTSSINPDFWGIPGEPQHFNVLGTFGH